MRFLVERQAINRSIISTSWLPELRQWLHDCCCWGWCYCPLLKLPYLGEPNAVSCRIWLLTSRSWRRKSISPAADRTVWPACYLAGPSLAYPIRSLTITNQLRPSNLITLSVVASFNTLRYLVKTLRSDYTFIGVDLERLNLTTITSQCMSGSTFEKISR
jgi:hypothetical protein